MIERFKNIFIIIKRRLSLLGYPSSGYADDGILVGGGK
jgi:hypothetical protein